MGTIMMSMSGEGRGHATRAHTLTEALKQDHHILLYTFGDALEFLSRIYADDDRVEVVGIDGLIFHYVNNKLNLSKSIYEGLKFYFSGRLQKQIQFLCDEIQTRQPDVLITDFEPILPRAATRCHVPYLSLTHQHFMVAYDLSSLPWKLRWHARSMAIAVYLHYSRQVETMIASFFRPKLNDRWKQAISLGAIIRPELHELNPQQGDYLLSYLRKHTTEQTIETLCQSPIPIKIYGVGELEPVGNATFHAIDPETFIHDLAGSKAVVSAAGNQLLGECLFLGKPVLAIPESNHHEQLINSHFLRKMKCGDFVTIDQFQLSDLQNFLNHLPEYQQQIAETCQDIDGTQKAIDVVNRYASQASAHRTEETT